MTFDQAKYSKARYYRDPEYRKNRIIWSAKWSKKNRKQINTANRKRYAQRTLQQKNACQRKMEKMTKYYSCKCGTVNDLDKRNGFGETIDILCSSCWALLVRGQVP